MVSAFCGLDRSSSLEKFMCPLPPKDFLPQPRCLKARRAAGSGWFVNNRTQKTAVNPLTPLASRSVMRPAIQSPHVEGLAATIDPSLD
jgi:hypothetical protein